MERYENKELDEEAKKYERGAAYPQLLRDSEAYQEVLNYFMEIAKERPDIDMIRIFWKDGNVLVGVKLGKEDVKDYKGDKGWFDDIIRKKVVGENDVHISAISIARATGTPAIRYSMPFDIGGERVGLIIINYKADKITEPIKNLKVGKEGYGMLIDPNYRNAEGKILGALFVANGRNPELEFDESSAGNLIINAEDLTGDEGTLTYVDDGREWTAYYRKVKLANGREYYALAAIPSSELTAISSDIRRNSIMIAAIAGILVAALGLVMSRRITKPIDRLVDDARAIAGGDLDREIKVSDSNDEVGVLTRAIQEMKNNVVNALRKSDSVIKGIPDPLVTVDRDMRVTYFNSAAEEITGYSASEAQGARFREIFQDEVEAIVREAMNAKDIIRNREANFSSINGEEIPVQVNAAPLFDASGDVYGGLVILKDMRELKERERQIIEAKEYLEAQVERLLPVVKAVAEGDLTKGITADRKDAFGTLIETFNRTRENLAKLVTKVKLASERVAATAEEQAASSEQLNAASDEITSAVQQIATKAQNQARLIDTSSKEMARLADMIRSIAENAGVAAESAKLAEQAAKQGSASAGEASAKMEAIRELSLASADKIRKLGERSREISDIVDMISSIAEQTNLLALNAAIEAARAGEHGKGFAVVAEEVRKLAESSAKAAEQIATMIQEVQRDVEEAVKAMEKGTQEVEGGTEVVAKALRSLEDIARAVEESTAKILEISEAAREQESISENVARSIEEVAVNAQEVASSSQEASAATEEQKASMEQLAASAQELARLAQELERAVNQFKVDEKTALKTEKKVEV